MGASSTHFGPRVPYESLPLRLRKSGALRHSRK